MSQVIYRGYGPGFCPGGSLVLVECDGQTVGPLPLVDTRFPVIELTGIAKAILADTLGEDHVSIALCLDFKNDVIEALWDRHEWELPQARVLEWVGEHRAREGGG